jgi:hypothetical protein
VIHSVTISASAISTKYHHSFWLRVISNASGVWSF